MICELASLLLYIYIACIVGFTHGVWLNLAKDELWELVVPSSRSIVTTVNDWIVGYYSD
jgi:hypothetical protein